MEFLPEDIENIIIDYKNQFERTYDCSIKHNHMFLEKTYRKNIIFHEHPYKFECLMCDYKICDDHNDEYIKKHTKKNLCVSCHMGEVQIKEILKDIKYDNKYLENELRGFKKMLYLFEDENLKELNNLLKERLEEGELQNNDLYDIVNTVYNKLRFFSFFEAEI